MVTRETLAQRLREARERAGLTQQQVADLLGVRRPAIAEMEAGKRAVESTELFRLAEIYGISLRWLVRGEEAAEDRVVAALFRAGEGVAHGVRQREVRRLARVCETIKTLEARLGLAKTHRPLPHYVRPGALVNQTAAYRHGGEAAIEERERLRLGLAPIRDVWGVLESAGFHIVPLRLGEETDLDALLVRTGDAGVCAGVNADRWVFRRIFSAVHEYAHAILDADVPAEACSVEPRRWRQLSHERRLRETRANQFAAVFLAPREALVQYFRSTGALRGDRIARLTPVEIVRAMDHFGMSAEGLLWRLQNAGLITAQQRHEALGFSVRAVARDLEIDFDVRRRPIGQAEVLALEGYRRGFVSLGKLAEVFGRPKEEMYELLRRWKVFQEFEEQEPAVGFVQPE
jgi:transcriptional regulator with XRE-family HTH domain/Zn-dependent peptidase ImmA (M78 family)